MLQYRGYKGLQLNRYKKSHKDKVAQFIKQFLEIFYLSHRKSLGNYPILAPLCTSVNTDFDPLFFISIIVSLSSLWRGHNTIQLYYYFS